MKNNISQPKVTAGIFQNCTFRVSGNANPHRGLMFFYPKNRIPTGVSDFQGVRKCKTPPGSGIFIVNYPTSWILADNFN